MWNEARVGWCRHKDARLTSIYRLPPRPLRQQSAESFRLFRQIVGRARSSPDAQTWECLKVCICLRGPRWGRNKRVFESVGGVLWVQLRSQCEGRGYAWGEDDEREDVRRIPSGSSLTFLWDLQRRQEQGTHWHTRKCGVHRASELESMNFATLPGVGVWIFASSPESEVWETSPTHARAVQFKRSNVKPTMQQHFVTSSQCNSDASLADSSWLFYSIELLTDQRSLLRAMHYKYDANICMLHLQAVLGFVSCTSCCNTPLYIQMHHSILSVCVFWLRANCGCEIALMKVFLHFPVQSPGIKRNFFNIMLDRGVKLVSVSGSLQAYLISSGPM